MNKAIDEENVHSFSKWIKIQNDIISDYNTVMRIYSSIHIIKITITDIYHILEKTFKII